MNKVSVVCKAVVLYTERNEKQILLLKRSTKDKNRPGEWDIPGGGREVSEDMTEAICREIREETGISVNQKQCQLFYANTEQVGTETIIRLLFAVPLDKKETVVLSNEHSDYIWTGLKHVKKFFNHRVYTHAIGDYFN